MYQRKSIGLHLNILLWKVGHLGVKKVENYRSNSLIMLVITRIRTFQDVALDLKSQNDMAIHDIYHQMPSRTGCLIK